MAFSISCASSSSSSISHYLKPRNDSTVKLKCCFGGTDRIARQKKDAVAAVFTTIKCESKESSSSSSAAAAEEETGLSSKRNSRVLEIGSPIIVIEAPKMIKTAASVPCLRVNAGLVKPGDVGRIVSRKPKDVWAVRLTIGTYLIDGKYFKPLELEE